MTFAKAVHKHETNKMTTTENGMPMRKSSTNHVVDLFFNIGAMRNWTPQEKILAFSKAFDQDEEVTTRILLWSRDIREGAGERDTFRTIIEHLCTHNYKLAERILHKIPELGRWDDVLEYFNTSSEFNALELIAKGLNNKDALAAKWMPRLKSVSKQVRKMEAAGADKETIKAKVESINNHNIIVAKIRKHLGINAKQYRKLLSSLSATVEQQMCAKQWSDINYSHVPSIAAKQYRKAFNRNDQDRYQDYLNALTKGSPEVKVNADAIFPHDVLSPIMGSHWRYSPASTQDKQLAEAQWKALPDYMNDSKVLPMVDSSGSMSVNIGGTTTAMQVAFALGLYISGKNTGPMKDVIMSFSSSPDLFTLTGDLDSRLEQLYKTPWGMSTNIKAAFKQLLAVAKKHKVPAEDMPETILILSDMQFDRCARDPDATFMKMIKHEYRKKGYTLPKIVFWNLNAKGTTPVKATKSGTALVSGFSPSILTSILSNIDDFTPEKIMLNTVMKERYNF